MEMRFQDDPWHFIGLSAKLMLDGDVDGAFDAAALGVQIAGDFAEAHYQYGLVLARRQAWRDAAQEFDRVAELSNTNAYAHYYAGLAYSRLNRPDRMANHFELFLKLAPDAPERPEVMQIMRTVRGR
jgi:tetratricopeptide (TPR) repeat protein